MTEQDAIALLRKAGYRVSKPKAPKLAKDRVGPTFVAVFADGQQTRMSVYTSLSKLDYERGVRMSCAAYESRARQRPNGNNVAVPPIMRAHFEQDGNVLAEYGEQVGAGLVSWLNEALAA